MKLEFTQAEIEDMIRRQLVADGYEPTSAVEFSPKKRFMGAKLKATVLVKKYLTPVPVEAEEPTTQESVSSD